MADFGGHCRQNDAMDLMFSAFANLFFVKMKAIFPLASFEVFKTIPCSTYMKTQSGLLCQVHFKINIDSLCRIVERKCVSCNAYGEEQPPAINAAYISLIGQLLFPKYNTEFGKSSSFAFAGAKIWNSIPFNIRSATTLSALKTKINNLAVF